MHYALAIITSWVYTKGHMQRRIEIGACKHHINHLVTHTQTHKIVETAEHVTRLECGFLLHLCSGPDSCPKLKKLGAQYSAATLADNSVTSPISLPVKRRANTLQQCARRPLDARLEKGNRVSLQ